MWKEPISKILSFYSSLTDLCNFSNFKEPWNTIQIRNSNILKCWIFNNSIGEISVAYSIGVSFLSYFLKLFQSFTILHICYIQLLPPQLAVFDMLFMAFLRSHFQIAFFSSHCSINSTFVSQAIQICFHLRWDSLPSFWYLILNDFSWIKMDQENWFIFSALLKMWC